MIQHTQASTARSAPGHSAGRSLRESHSVSLRFSSEGAFPARDPDTTFFHKRRDAILFPGSMVLSPSHTLSFLRS